MLYGWKEEFDAYKLSRCMCPSNYNRLWDRARYLWKNCHFIIPPLHSTPPLGGFPSEYWHPLWYRKTRMVLLPDGEKMSKICLFGLTWSTNVTDRQMDGHCMTAYASHRAVKISFSYPLHNSPPPSVWINMRVLKLDDCVNFLVQNLQLKGRSPYWNS